MKMLPVFFKKKGLSRSEAFVNRWFRDILYARLLHKIGSYKYKPFLVEAQGVVFCDHA